MEQTDSHSHLNLETENYGDTIGVSFHLVSLIVSRLVGQHFIYSRNLNGRTQHRLGSLDRWIQLFMPLTRFIRIYLESTETCNTVLP